MRCIEVVDGERLPNAEELTAWEVRADMNGDGVIGNTEKWKTISNPSTSDTDWDDASDPLDINPLQNTKLIYNNKGNWDNVNLRIYPAVAHLGEGYWPQTKGVGGYWDGISWWEPLPGMFFAAEVILPTTFVFNGVNVDIGDAFYSCMIVHELGHYVFGLYEEYAKNGYADLNRDTLMCRNGYYLSYRTLYGQQNPPNTMQWAKRGKSCWEWFIEEMRRHGLLTDPLNVDVRRPEHVPYAALRDQGRDVPNVNYQPFSSDCYDAGVSRIDRTFERVYNNALPHLQNQFNVVPLMEWG
ncbi:MAG: hypothetical protein QXE27_07835 [Thermoplasmata archaeon]